MNLPFLEFLNLSYNNIKNIEPLGELNSKKLKYLFLQKNQIEDIKCVNDWDFPKLRILRLENNDKLENSNSFQENVDKYKKNKLIIVTKTIIEEIKKQYNITYDENTKILKLEGEAKENEKKEELDKKEEDEENEEDELILMNLFIIISQKSENSITKLKVNNFKIKNPSILKRIRFDFLDELNLSNNNIKNLQFLKGIKAEHLNRLYLDYNNINDLSLLDKINDLFPHLEKITLNNNSLNLEESQKNNLIKNLDDKNIKLQI
jgi:Leucine-rich repeat (LRR) protein